MEVLRPLKQKKLPERGRPVDSRHKCLVRVLDVRDHNPDSLPRRQEWLREELDVVLSTGVYEVQLPVNGGSLRSHK